MSETTTGKPSAAVGYPEAPSGTLEQTQRAFSLSMLVSGIRCILAYVVLPFVTPLIGFAPGVGPALGIPIGAVAVAANAISMRGFGG